MVTRKGSEDTNTSTRSSAQTATERARLALDRYQSLIGRCKQIYNLQESLGGRALDTDPSSRAGAAPSATTALVLNSEIGSMRSGLSSLVNPLPTGVEFLGLVTGDQDLVYALGAMVPPSEFLRTENSSQYRMTRPQFETRMGALKARLSTAEGKQPPDVGEIQDVKTKMFEVWRDFQFSKIFAAKARYQQSQSR